MRRHLAAVLAAVLLAGCGGTTDLTSSAASVLKRDADVLTAAARAGDGTGVQAALAVLRRDVAAQQKSGELTSARAQRVLTAAMTLARDVPAPVPTVSPTPEVTATPDSGGHGRGKKKNDEDDGD